MILIIFLVFPEEYKARQQEVNEEETESGMILPLFIMGGICFPGEDFPLHVYDPRYRIMLKYVILFLPLLITNSNLPLLSDVLCKAADNLV